MSTTGFKPSTILTHSLALSLGAVIAYSLAKDDATVIPVPEVTSDSAPASPKSNYRPLDLASSPVSVNSGTPEQSASNQPNYQSAQQVLVADIPQSEVIDELMDYVDRRMAIAPWNEVADEVLALPGGPARAYAMLSIVEEASDAERSALIADFLPKLEGLEYRSVSTAIAAKWAESDPAGAFAFGIDQPQGEFRQTLLNIGASELARNNPAGATQTIEDTATELGNFYPNIVNEFASTWAETNPDEAVAWYQKASASWEPKTRDEGYFNLLTTQAQDNPNLALQKLDVVTTPSVRSEIRETIYRLWGESDPSAAGAHLASQEYDATLISSIRTLSLEWSDYDPKAAKSWLETLDGPDDALKATMFRNIER